jgi:hypothetical protein
VPEPECWLAVRSWSHVSQRDKARQMAVRFLPAIFAPPAHDSGLVGVATPSPQWIFTTCLLPVARRSMISVRESTLLMPMQRIIGGIEIENDLRWRIVADFVITRGSGRSAPVG